MKQEIKNLIEISHKIGSRLDYVQGGGGNISVKISSDLMAIKASGYELKNLSENDGFAFVNYQKISNEITKFCAEKNGDDQVFSAAVKSLTLNIDNYPNLRPSMETGFHSLIPFQYVAHTHSVYGNVLACAKEGEKIIQKLFPQSLFVEYSNPGWQVTAAISEALQRNSRQEKYLPKIILLQNHGLIISANDVDEVFDLHEEVNQKIKSYLNLESFDLNKIKLREQGFMTKHILFPDQIVYGLFAEIAESEIGIHTFLAYSYILQAIERAALTPLFLQQKDIDFVANMESEKYRREVAKK